MLGNKAPHFAEVPHPRTLYRTLISNNELDYVRFENFVFLFTFLHRSRAQSGATPLGGEKIIGADAHVKYVYTEPLLYEIHVVPTRGSV